jgi:hypothetical protein
MSTICINIVSILAADKHIEILRIADNFLQRGRYGASFYPTARKNYMADS